MVSISRLASLAIAFATVVLIAGALLAPRADAQPITKTQATATAVNSVFKLPGIECPPGWEKAPPNLNPELGHCINDTITIGKTPVPLTEAAVVVDAGGGGDDGAAAGDFSVRPCPPGSAIHPAYVEAGCLPYGSGPWAP